MADNPYSIMNLDPASFVGALDELGLAGDERQRLMDMYYAEQRLLPMTGRPEGRKVGTILPMSWPEGMTGGEALMSGDWEWSTPELVRGLYEAPAEALNVTSAMQRGVPTTEQQRMDAAMIAAGMTAGMGQGARMKPAARAATPDVPSAPPANLSIAQRVEGLMQRAQNGEDLTPDEAFDVMTFERHGEDGVYDPTNTFENWSNGVNDHEGAQRIANLTGLNREVGQNPVIRDTTPYFDDTINVEDIDWDAEPEPGYWDAQDAALARQTPIQELQLRRAGGQELNEAELQRLQDWDAEMGGLEQMQPNEPTDFYSSYTGFAGEYTSPNISPIVHQDEGIAGLYSPTRRAVDLLDRPQYDNIDSLRVQLLNRGAKPDEVDRVISRLGDDGPVSREQLARLADEQSRELQVRQVTRRNTDNTREQDYVSGYFLDGVEDLHANVIEAPVPNKPQFSELHFKGSTPDRAPLVHTRTGMLWSDAAPEAPDSYHVGEIQSDWAQRRAKLFKDANEIEGARERLITVKDDVDVAYQELVAHEHDMISQGNNQFASDPEWVILNKRFQEGQNEVYALNERFDDLKKYGTRADFDANFPAPYVGTTSKWVQLGLRQALADAVNAGARQMSLSTGELAQGYTYGKLSGQQKFYDNIVPKELNDVLKKFSKEAGITKPEIEMSTVYGSEGQAYTVPVVRFTDEFIDAVKRVGLPAFKEGGTVSGGAPNRMQAYQEAQSKKKPEKGVGYTELFVDNLLGLDNGYDTFMENMAGAAMDDPLGFLGSAGYGMYEGAKNAVMHPIDTASNVASGLYESGSNIAQTLGPDPQYLDNKLMEMYGVTYDEATDEEVTKAREAMIGDVLNVASAIPAVGGAAKVAGKASEALDVAQRAAAEKFRESVRPEHNPTTALDSRFYYPTYRESKQMAENPTDTQAYYLDAVKEAENLLDSGVSPEVVQDMTGFLAVPLNTTTGESYGYRLVAGVDPEDFTAFRPKSELNLDVQFVPLKGYQGVFDVPDLERRRNTSIKVDSRLPLAQKESVFKHELTHFDLHEAGIDSTERGYNTDAAFLDRLDGLKTLDKRIAEAKSPEDKEYYKALRKKLANTSPVELYYNNPGELLARLSEGDPLTAKKLSTSQLLNPYINNAPAHRRYLEGLGSLVAGSEKPHIQWLEQLLRRQLSSDKHIGVSSDMSKAILAAPEYRVRNPKHVVIPRMPGAPDPWADVGEAPFLDIPD